LSQELTARRFGPLLCLIVLAGWALRLFRLDYHTAWVDEAFIVFFAEQSWPALIQGLQLYEPHPPLYFALMHLWLQPPLSDLWLRATSVLFGTATVAAVGVLGRRLLGPGSGLAAALLAAVSAYGIWYSQEARMYAASACFGVWSAVLLVRALDRSPARGPWVLYGAVALAGLLTHYFFALALVGNLAAALLLAYRPAGRTEWKALAVVHFLVVLAWIPWLLSAQGVLTSRRGGGELLSFPDLFWQTWRWLAFGRALVVAPSLWNLLAVGLGAVTLGLTAMMFTRWHTHRPVAALILWVSAPLLATLVVSRLVGGVYSDRYVIFLLPLLVVLVVAPLAARQPLIRGLAVVSVAGFACTNLLSLGWYWFHPVYGKGEDFRQVAAVIQQGATPGDILVENDNNETLRYYLYRVGSSALPWVIVPIGGNGAVRADADRETAEVARTHERVWLTERSTRFWWDPSSMVEKWLGGHCPKLSESNVGGARVLLFRTGTACKS
jgi:mannosyltransferase